MKLMSKKIIKIVNQIFLIYKVKSQINLIFHLVIKIKIVINIKKVFNLSIEN